MGLSRRKIYKTIKSSKKWTKQEQSYFLLRLAELLKEGFSLGEALKFLQIMIKKHKNDIQKILGDMEKGDAFPNTLKQFGIADQLIVQLHFSMLHANFQETILFGAEYIASNQKQAKQFQKVVAYPFFLLVLSFVMLAAIRQFLLPMLQGSAETGMTQKLIFILTYLPQILFGTSIFVLSMVLLSKKYLSKKTAYEKACLYSRIPFLKKWMKDYYSFFFSREIAYFILNGQSIFKMIESMKAEYTQELMKQVAELLEVELTKGRQIPDVIAGIPFLKTEMGWIIYHGELTSQLGIKLRIYSDQCYRLLMDDIERKINWIQPVLFLLIGLIIVMIYLVLMLPVLNMMGGIS